MNLKNVGCSRLLRWIFRFRQRCGYGIHSPFAFNFVTGVVYESGEYYAYADLLLQSAKKGMPLRVKDEKFLFRLANFAEPGTGLIVGDSLGITSDYLQRGRCSCHWTVMSPPNVRLPLPHQSFPDFIYFDSAELVESHWHSILQGSSDRTVIVLRQIHATEATSALWQRLLQDNRVRVSFDLYDFGVLFFESRLNKENYVINYF